MPKMKKSELVALIKECVVEIRAENKTNLVEGRKNNSGKKPAPKKTVAETKKVAPKKGK